MLWVQMPAAVDSLELYRRGLAPGYLLAPGPGYRNFIRLNAAVLSAEPEWAVRRLGGLAGELAHSSQLG